MLCSDQIVSLGVFEPMRVCSFCHPEVGETKGDVCNTIPQRWTDISVKYFMTGLKYLWNVNTDVAHM